MNEKDRKRNGEGRGFVRRDMHRSTGQQDTAGTAAVRQGLELWGRRIIGFEVPGRYSSQAYRGSNGPWGRS